MLVLLDILWHEGNLLFIWSSHLNDSSGKHRFHAIIQNIGFASILMCFCNSMSIRIKCMNKEYDMKCEREHFICICVPFPPAPLHPCAVRSVFDRSRFISPLVYSFPICVNRIEGRGAADGRLSLVAYKMELNVSSVHTIWGGKTSSTPSTSK